MKILSLDELRRAYLEFFASKGHAIIPSASLIPDNDPTVLFTTAGMHPLVPYLLGEKHPLGIRLTNSQKCIRTADIDDVGDNTHLTFFEMLGNWSLGDYFKEEAIKMSFEFLTKVLEIPVEKLAVTCFAGDEDAPRDEEAAQIWQETGIPKERIVFLPKSDNWWGPAGQTGPCGPDTEMFFDTTEAACDNGDKCLPGCECGRWVEIWNDVFMQYFKQDDGSFKPLEQKNVDTGMGLERTVVAIHGKKSVFDIEPFVSIINKIRTLASGVVDEVSERIIADHLRAAVFILADGITPSNVDQGYVLRKLIRRAVRSGIKIGIEGHFTVHIADAVIGRMSSHYSELTKKRDFIISELQKEEEQFATTLKNGLKQFDKLLETKSPGDTVTGKEAFHLYDTYGFPIEMTLDLAKENNLVVDRAGFDEAYLAHQENSRAGAEQKFAGGLADHSDRVVRMHTATHLMHMALRIVLGDHVAQKGSNITQERLRFDFDHNEKMTPEQKEEVERIVNQQIERKLDVSYQEMTVPEAKSQDVIGLFEDRYGDMVKVYTIGDFSREICGGPHVANTELIGKFKIKKEEASSKGVRRIKAVVEDYDGLPSPIPTAQQKD